ncbi:Chromosome (plasmid) partitioning protein ParB [hydrothermal vent metagenome]|uniref:Chromosome (Plasmid) partitioning protein ParB n=1 Tax=hydrothermal vent metagenome TaxID=652676 RepID=A0A3B0U189_9ZZZZ
MNEKPNRLGRGLAALIGDAAPINGPRVVEASGLKRLPVEFIVANKRNPRRDFDPELLEELANSIREKGVMQPLLVRPSGQGPDIYELIAGERRWRASQIAGLHEVPVIIREVDDKEALELAIIENVQRADLNSVDEALGYGELMDQFDYTQNDLAQVIGKSRSHVANTLRLLRLPQDVQQMLAGGELTAGHARTLITAQDPSALAKKIVSGGLSVRQAEALSQRRNEPGGAPKPPVPKDADVLALEKELSDRLGMHVIVQSKGESGRVEIRYKTLEQLDHICNRLR